MRSSNSKSRANMRIKMFWAICFYLALELGLFVIVKQILHAPEGELVGPYLAFAVPGVILLPAAWRLRKWEERGASPRRLALWWGMLIVSFASAVLVAFVYSGIELHLIDPSDIVGGSVVAGVLLIPTAFFTMYHRVLSRTSARAARHMDGSRPG